MAAETNRYAVGDPAARQPDPDPQPGTARSRASRRSRARSGRNVPSCSGPSAIMVGIGLLMIAIGLRLRSGCAGAAGCTTRAGSCAWRCAMRPARLHRRTRRLDHHRGRPPALGRLRPAAHRRRASRRSPRRRVVASLVAVRGRLLRRLRRRHLLPAPPDARPAAVRAGAAAPAEPMRTAGRSRRPTSRCEPGGADAADGVTTWRSTCR